MEINKAFQQEGLTLNFDGNTVFMTGNCNARKPDLFMLPFFDEVHSYTIENKIKKITVDIRNLEFINSASILELIVWVIKPKTLPDDQKYTITFLCNKKHIWQESSVSKLISFSDPAYVKADFS